MRPFRIYPERKLEKISKILSDEFLKWSHDWKNIENTEISISSVNAFNGKSCENDAFYKCLLPGDSDDIYLSGKVYDLFGKLVVGDDYLSSTIINESTDNTIYKHVIEDAIYEYLNLIFPDADASIVKDEEVELSYFRKKGNGFIAVMFSFEGVDAEIFFPSVLYEKVFPEVQYHRISDDLGSITINNLNSIINVSVALNKTKLNIKDLMELSHGDYLVLEHDKNHGLNFLTEGQCVVKCGLGSLGNNKAVQIIN